MWLSRKPPANRLAAKRDFIHGDKGLSETWLSKIVIADFRKIVAARQRAVIISRFLHGRSQLKAVDIS
jgi:hypothetical protein